MQKFIYFFRHGETSFSSRNRPYGDYEHRALLTPKGRQEVALLGLELAKRGPFDLFLTSPLPRAVQTATIVHTFLKNEVELQIETDLSEPINEPGPKTWERIARLGQQLVENNNRQILLSTHGFIFVCLTAYFRGMGLDDIRTLTNPPTGSFGWIEILDGKPARGCRISDGHLTSPVNNAGSSPVLA